MIDDYIAYDDSALFNHHAYGQTAEQQLMELPEPQDVDGMKHKAVLLKMAHQGRVARDEILRRNTAGEFLYPQHFEQAAEIQRQAQEEKDQQIVQGLASGELIIASQEDEQRLRDNANARAKFRSSPDIEDDQRQTLIDETYANDAEIRRAAIPIPPEQQARSPDLQRQKLIAAMPESDRDKPWQYDAKSGTLQMPRGYKEPEADQDQEPVPPPWEEPEPGDAVLFDVPTEKVPDAQPQPQGQEQQQRPLTPGQRQKLKNIQNPTLCDPDVAAAAIANGELEALIWNGDRRNGPIGYRIDKDVLAAVRERRQAQKDEWEREHPKPVLAKTPEERADERKEKKRTHESAERKAAIESAKEIEVNIQNGLEAWETNNKPPDETVSGILGIGEESPNPEYAKWQKKRDAKEAALRKIWSKFEYKPQPFDEESPQGQPEAVQVQPQEQPREVTKQEYDQLPAGAVYLRNGKPFTKAQ